MGGDGQVNPDVYIVQILSDLNFKIVGFRTESLRIQLETLTCGEPQLLVSHQDSEDNLRIIQVVCLHVIFAYQSY